MSKRKLLILLMTMLLLFLNASSQDTVTCVHDQFMEANPQLKFQSLLNGYGTKYYRKTNPNLVFYPKPQPDPPCDICMTINPSCFKSRYALPIIVHIVAKQNDTVIGQGSNIPETQVYNAIANLIKQ
jgi:hypothetical protein